MFSLQNKIGGPFLKVVGPHGQLKWYAGRSCQFNTEQDTRNWIFWCLIPHNPPNVCLIFHIYISHNLPSFMFFVIVLVLTLAWTLSLSLFICLNSQSFLIVYCKHAYTKYAFRILTIWYSIQFLPDINQTLSGRGQLPKKSFELCTMLTRML